MNQKICVDTHTYHLALVPGVKRESVMATRKFELLFVNNPRGLIVDLDDFLEKCHHIVQPTPRIRSLSRILSVYVKTFPNSIDCYHKETILMLISKWVKLHPQTAVICYCSKIMVEFQSEFRELFLDFRDFILYQQSNHSKGVQSIIRNHLQ